MPARTITRRAFLSAAAVAGLGVLAGCARAGESAPADRRASVAVSDRVPPAPEVADELVLVAVGDVLLHPSVQESGLRSDGSRDYAHLFARVADEVSAADLALVSQETVLGGEGLGLSGYPCFNGPQEVGDAEVAAGFDVVLHANNHALDKGLEGIGAELAFWRSRHPDVLVTGMADDAEAARGAAVVERGGRRVAVLNYATSTNGIPLPEPWAVRMISEEQVSADVAAAREAGAEAIVAVPHWGDEYAPAPSDEQRRWAQVLADSGVDAIVGGHPHVLQPLEALTATDGRVVPVAWSLGNFVSGQDRMDAMVGGLARVTLSFSPEGARVSECRLGALVTHRAKGEALTTYRLADYTDELAAANGIRWFEGCAGFSRQWCVDFCAERLGPGFDPVACEVVWRAGAAGGTS